MVRRIALLALVAVSSAVAQTAPLPPTASALCRQEGQNEQGRLLAADRATGRTSDPVAIVAAAKKITRTCAAGIDVATASMRERADLAALYVYTNDTSKAESLVDAMLREKGSEANRADAKLAAIRLAIAKWDAFAGPNPDGERFAAEIDAMSDSVINQKIDAHYALLGRYEYADLDAPIRDQAQRVLAIARRGVGSPGTELEFAL